MLRILKTLKAREWIYFALGVGFIVLQVFLDLTMPDYMSTITELAVSGAASGMAEIWKNGALMLACALGSALSSAVVGFFAARIAAAVWWSISPESSALTLSGFEIISTPMFFPPLG